MSSHLGLVQSDRKNDPGFPPAACFCRSRSHDTANPARLNRIESQYVMLSFLVHSLLRAFFGMEKAERCARKKKKKAQTEVMGVSPLA